MSTEDAEKLAQQWERDAAQYQRQVDEARGKDLPHDCMLGTASTLRACVRDLRALIKKP